MNDEPEPSAVPATKHYRRALRLEAVMAVTGMGRSFLYARMAEDPPSFPRPRKVGRASIWDADEVDIWVSAHLDGKIDNSKAK